ncbi:sugar ABC transporter substrate-binding protein [Actinoplanes sp. SE50]|uniref:ABC transporter substrate-binding protein n=1 Tax=unclassified Actinoplanes TaxID=2626549 RepID=UPI00023ECDA8|nr:MULTISPECIES: ABC transporter substrate-binding protein [unclassified Actinoplanes]AEV87763.1 putative sugar-binding periplasmic protein [Actinoplanes sp. SE50/110]ATO86165.1 sugar ABC transporter substrate-binding protein [Actinoplanes sp. SE50]SLM03579.1 sugar ABC transporter substrate-binding protein [Actinoplanes sp. SE50/110]
MRKVAVFAVAALLTVAACTSADHDEPAPRTVEVFTWWTEGGEKAGLDALVGRFTADCPGQRFRNGAVAGGAGVNAKQELTRRMARHDPPDTFQAHAGAELTDYIDAGQVEDLTSYYTAWNLRGVLPAGLVDDLTVRGRIYSIPVGVHRANVVWSNPAVLARAGITGTPGDLPALLADLGRLRAAGVEAPLAVGRDWTQLMLLEAVLISDLGAQRFAGLFTGATSWGDALVTRAIADFATLLTFANADRDTLDWPQAERLLIDGKAGYQLMGDWEAADLAAKGATDYRWFTFPGNGRTFQWLADSFTMATGAPNISGTECWLKTVSSAAGQQAFNSVKGSIPARTDIPAADFSPYQRSAMADWRSATPVPSCAHGSACSQPWQAAITKALDGYTTGHDRKALQAALVRAAAQFLR